MSDTHQCGGCGGCGSKGQAPQEPKKLAPNPLSQVGTVICVMGATDKSLVTAALAAELHRRGKQVAIFDADITTPSIQTLFEIPQGVTRGEAGLYPALTQDGVKLVSISLMLEDETDLITTRGAAMAAIVSQLWTGAIWDRVDVLLIDMPPGIQDVTALVLDDFPLDAALILTPPGPLGGHHAAQLSRFAETHDVRTIACAQALDEANIADIIAQIEEV